jgi:hypothetical protein
MRGMMPRERKARRQREESYALSARSFSGRGRGRPRRFLGSRSGGIASMVTSSLRESCTLAPDTVTDNGTPLRSTTMWRFVPSLPRFVGSLPVCSPPREPAHSHCQAMHASSRSGPHPGAIAGARDASASTPLLAAGHAAASSTSCHFHSPTPGAASPTGCRSSRQTRSPSRRRGP